MRPRLDEGDSKHYTFTTSDPGTDTFMLDAVELRCERDARRAGGFNTATGAGSFDCTFPDGPASSTVSVTVSDSDGAPDSDSITVTIANVAPTVVLTGDDAANEGSTHTYTYTVDRSGCRHVCDRPSECERQRSVYTDTPAASSFDCTFPDGPASSTVKVTADDGDPTATPAPTRSTSRSRTSRRRSP